MRPPGLESQAAAPLVLRGEAWVLLASSFWPAWLLLAATSLAAVVAWRLADSAPSALTLCDGLSAALWLSALLLIPAWERVLLRQRFPAEPGPRLQRRWQYGAVALLAALGLATAPLGALLAFEQNAHLVAARPLDVDPFFVTLPKLLAYLLPICGPPVALTALASLAILRSVAGVRSGTALWLVVGVAVHTPLLSGLQSGPPLTLGGIGRIAMTNFATSEPLLFDRMLAPVQLWMWGYWLAALILAVLSLALRPAGPGRLSPLELALLAGAAAAGLRTVTLARAWVDMPQQLTPDALMPLMHTFLAATLLVWTLLSHADPAAAGRELRTGWWRLFPVGALLLLLTAPLIRAGQTDHRGALIAVAVGLMLLTCALFLLHAALTWASGPLAIARSFDMASRQDFMPWLAGGVILSAIALTLPMGELSRPPLYGLLSWLLEGAANAQTRPQALVLLVSLVAASVVAVAIVLPRRYRPQIGAKKAA